MVKQSCLVGPWLNRKDKETVMFDTFFDPIVFGVNLIDAALAQGCSCGCCGVPTTCGAGQGAGQEPVIVCPAT